MSTRTIGKMTRMARAPYPHYDSTKPFWLTRTFGSLRDACRPISSMRRRASTIRLYHTHRSPPFSLPQSRHEFPMSANRNAMSVMGRFLSSTRPVNPLPQIHHLRPITTPAHFLRRSIRRVVTKHPLFRRGMPHQLALGDYAKREHGGRLAIDQHDARAGDARDQRMRGEARVFGGSMPEAVFAITEGRALDGADRERQQTKQREYARSGHAKPVTSPVFRTA